MRSAVVMMWMLAACGREAPATDPVGTTAAPEASTIASGETWQREGASTTSTSGPADVWARGLPAAAARELDVLAASVRKGLPASSADYSQALALVMLHKRKSISFEQLSAALVGRHLPPHRLGDGYLMMPSPVPPPGVKSDPAIMPDDWDDTWGEVAMAFYLGELSRDTYDKLHSVAHPSCKR